MIVFDLKCDQGHVFEAWFADSATYERQVKRHHIACPVCGASHVEKAPMAPNVATGRETGDLDRTNAAKTSTQRHYSMLQQMRDHVEKNCDYVGDKFADEARKIHHEEVDKHNIYGEATQDESRELKEEGIEFGAIPWVPRHDS